MTGNGRSTQSSVDGKPERRETPARTEIRHEAEFTLAASPDGPESLSIVTPLTARAEERTVVQVSRREHVENSPAEAAEEHRHFLVWKVPARARAEAIANEIETLRLTALPSAAARRLDAAEGYVEAARRICVPDTGFVDRLAGLFELYTGSAQERAWGAIHEADVLLTYVRDDKDVQAELPGLRQTIKERVASDKDRDDLTRQLTEDVENPMNKPGIAQLKRLLYKLSDEGYEEKRTFRNIVIAMIVVVAAVTAILAVPGWFGESLFGPLLKAPNGKPPPLWKVELVGAIAGLLVAIVALNKLSGLRGPYSLQFVQAVLKIPMGALTGLLGAVIVRSGLLSISSPARPVVFFTWVFVFGASQQLITRFVDQKAKTVLAGAKPGV